MATKSPSARSYAFLSIGAAIVTIALKGHELCEEIELAISRALPNTSITTHLEPLNEPLSWADLELERKV